MSEVMKQFDFKSSDILYNFFRLKEILIMLEVMKQFDFKSSDILYNFIIINTINIFSFCIYYKLNLKKKKTYCKYFISKQQIFNYSI